MTIENVTGLENPTEIAKLLQALIDQKSTIDLDNLSVEGQAKFTQLQQAITSNSNSITTINNELANKLEAEVLKEQNGYIKFNNGLIIQWGINGTDNDGIARINLPISFTNNNYIVSATHSGGDIASCSVIDSYKSITFLPIILINVRSHDSAGGWSVLWSAIGF